MGGEIGINDQNGHLWLFDHQNISKGIPENNYENVLGHCKMLIANFTAKKFFLCFPVETLKTKILCQVTLMGPTFSPKLVSFSGALDKNKQTTRIQNYLSHFFLNSFVFFFSSSSFCRMLGPLMVGFKVYLFNKMTIVKVNYTKQRETYIHTVRLQGGR